jgi:hypothetical protein
MLISHLIAIPERVQPGDFVLNLSEGVSDEAAAATLRNYVVTPELQRNFADALGAVKGALDARSSRAGYLHGSFGSGKSHFMAVLFLLLRGNLAARSMEGLAPLLEAHDAWLGTKTLLCVPFHMIGARSMEQGIFGQYLAFVRRRHPEAPLPGVFRSGPILENARNLRATLGDERFFAALNAGKGDDEWGAFGAGWTAETFDAAVAAPPDHEAHVRLVGDLVSTLLPAVRQVAQAGGEFIDLDAGLAALSRHAKALGYDALVLFLDELILWLASHAANPAFVAEEGQKLVKLTEAQDVGRPVPIVSFVARQRDLRELVGQQFTGAEELAFHDVLKHWESRFFKITLEDRNLPAIISKRILAPVSPAAEQQLDRAFAEATRDHTVVNALLTREADLAMFRQVYPFTPALVQALVAVSSMLQRERTAIKVLLQLLVKQRHTLALGDLVPVGDLFDEVAEGSDAFSEALRRHFDQAKRLYETKLQPLVEEQRGARFADLAGGTVPPATAQAMRADDRLVKTLLLAALVPEVEALRGLTPGRLAALNHGTIRTPIPGAEKQLVLARVRAWASRVGEVRVGDDTDNPTLAVQLAGVDVESIIERARTEDNTGNRRRKVRELLFEQLGVTDAEGLFQTHECAWKGTRRRAEIVYGNVRELADDHLRARGDLWRVVIDFPFDPEPHHTPADDLARVAQFRGREGPTRTLVWVPSFLSASALSDLGTLVVLDHVLAGERFQQYAGHLSPLDRQTARGLLENRQAQLRQRLRQILEGAYGIVSPAPGTLVHELEPAEQFQSLDPVCRLRPAVGVNLREALDHLLAQALDAQYPRHPDFGDAVEIKPALVRRVWNEVQAALQLENWRKVVEQAQRKAVRQIVFPLELCDVGEDVIVVKRTWQQHLDRYHAQEGGPLTVKRLRGWIDLPEARGLLPELQNLVILTYAEMTNRRFTLHGGPATASIDAIDDRCELVEDPPPPPADWEEARSRAARLFGLDLPALRTATTAGEAAEQIAAAAKQLRPAVQDLAGRLPRVQRQFGTDEVGSARARSLASAAALLEALERAPHRSVIATLAHATLATTPEAVGATARRAGEGAEALKAVNWQPVEALPNLGDARAAAAQQLLADLREVLERDELAVALGPKLREIERRAVALLIPPRGTEPVPPVRPPEPAPAPPDPGWKVVDQGGGRELAPGEARSRFDAALKKTRTDRTRVSVSWTIEERTGE